MKSYLSWNPGLEKDEVFFSLPEDSVFECPKLNKGDIISIDVADTSGSSGTDRILTPVKVSSVLIGVSIDSGRNLKSPVISDAEQHVYVEPLVIEEDARQKVDL